MDRITLIRTEDNTIWVTSEENQIGTESAFKDIQADDKQMLIALAEFLGFEPAIVLCFDDEDWG